MEHPRAAVQELIRVIKPEGFVFLIDSGSLLPALGTPWKQPALRQTQQVPAARVA